ncbi:FliM/FliN family flagellar motor switch protein [Sodalis sp. RH15]|uniref:FliM/FliN family flagellar motor switch protein n=1 Tax=Sodalis sp. RH15 TaxID=3394330 RepID=UPI0039B4BEC8
MSYRQLRSLPRTQMNWRRVLASWRTQDIAVSLETPVHVGRRMLVSADGGVWRALMDPREWLCHEFPELATLAGAACDDEKIMALFNIRSRPLTFAHKALTYRSLRAEGLIEQGGGHSEPLPRVSARECTLWITDIADSLVMKPRSAGTCLSGMPLAVEWIIGSSRVPGALAKQLSAGDVLLISKTENQVRCQGITIGTYWQKEEMIMIKENHQLGDLPEGDGMTSPAEEPVSGALAAVPLKVEFILQRRYLPIGELQQLFKGQVLEIDPSGEKNIEIRANGHVMAVGELVQLEDRLGVEIMSLHQDRSNEH